MFTKNRHWQKFKTLRKKPCVSLFSINALINQKSVAFVGHSLDELKEYTIVLSSIDGLYTVVVQPWP